MSSDLEVSGAFALALAVNESALDTLTTREMNSAWLASPLRSTHDFFDPTG